jgi:hypothetical protein
VFGLSASIKKAIKKEVTKQVSSATGPAGTAGASGAAGAAGSPSASMLTGRITGIATTGTEFGSISGTSTVGTEANVAMRSPRATIVASDLDVRIDTSTGNVMGDSRVYTLIDDSTATALACTMQGTGIACNDPDDVVTIAPGSQLSLRVSSIGSPAGTIATFGLRAGTP